jgi:hypothetical protein
MGCRTVRRKYYTEHFWSIHRKEPLERPRHRRENTKMGLKETSCEDVGQYGVTVNFHVYGHEYLGLAPLRMGVHTRPAYRAS